MIKVFLFLVLLANCISLPPPIKFSPLIAFPIKGDTLIDAGVYKVTDSIETIGCSNYIIYAARSDYKHFTGFVNILDLISVGFPTPMTQQYLIAFDMLGYNNWLMSHDYFIKYLVIKCYSSSL